MDVCASISLIPFLLSFLIAIAACIGASGKVSATVGLAVIVLLLVRYGRR